MTDPKHPKRSDDLPSFDPQGTESISEIPERFLLGGLLTLDREGAWRFQQDVIEHKGVCHFLQTRMRRNAEGQYWVINGPQRVMVVVEDVPYRIQQVRLEPTQILLRINDDTEEPLRPGTLRMQDEETLYAEVKHGLAGAVEGEGHRARFSRAAIAQLAPCLAETNDGLIGLEIQGQVIPIQAAIDAVDA